MTLCTVASRHACNVVMIEVILCAASLSLCYTATCYDISGCIGSCWCTGDSKCKFHPSYPSRTNTNPVEAAFTGLLLPWCLQHNGSKDMHKQVLTCWWQSHYPNWFPLLYMYSWCQMDAKYTAQILDRNPSEKCSELIHSLCPTSMLWYQSQ